MWATHDTFSHLVASKWSAYKQQVQHGTRQIRLEQILKLLKSGLKELNTMHFQHISARAAAARQRLEEAQEAGLTNSTMAQRITACRNSS